MRASLEKVVSEYERLKRITPGELEQERLAKLQFLVRHHYEKNAVYKAMLDARAVRPEHIKSLSDIRLLPIVTTEDIIINGNSFFTVQLDAIRRFLHTSGSTGTPKIIPVSDDEVEKIFSNDALADFILGIKGEGVNFCMYPFGPYPSAFFAQGGGELLGPTEAADMRLPIERHLRVMKRFNPAYIMTSPSYISYLASELGKTTDLRKLGIKVIKLAGEQFSERFRIMIEEIFRAQVMDLYGCAEFGAASVECHESKGRYHHALGHEFIFETKKIGISDQMTGFGEEGELLITALGKTSIPIVRYQVKDIATLVDPSQKCPCGLNLPLMKRLHGRTDDMMTYGGANIYPQMIYSVLASLGLDDKFQVVIGKDDSGLRDNLIVNIEISDGTHNKDEKDLAARIEAGLRERSSELDYVFGAKLVNPLKVNLFGYGKLYKVQGKLKRFVDKRSEQ